MNLNANQIKVLAYLRQYVGKDIPGRHAMADDLNMARGTVGTVLIALQRGGMIQLSEARPAPTTVMMPRKELLFCADVPKVKASTDTQGACRAAWERERRKALAEGTRR